MIKGPGSGTSFTAFVVTKKATIENVTITGFYATRGGTAVGGANSNWTQASNVTGINCVIADNKSAASAVYGGVWTNCVFSCNTNSSSDGGAGCYGTYYDCFFTNNMAASSGGALFRTTVYSSRFIGNVSSSKGGGIYGGTAYDCDFTANRSPLGGAGCAITSDTSAYYNCRFFNNVSTRTDEGGGAIKGQYESSLVASNCLFVGNYSEYKGGGGCGGVYHDCIFSNNTSKINGGGLCGATAYNCFFVMNSSSEGGAVNGGTSRNCKFFNNSAGRGGAVGANSGYTKVYDSEFRYNRSTRSDDGGGAVWAGTAAACVSSNCVFVSNSSYQSGGAGRSGSFYDCSFISNKTERGEWGGGMNNGVAVRCFFTGNTARFGGGCQNVTATDCVFSNNITRTGNETYGVAIYKGTAKNCLIVDNIASHGSGSVVESATCVNCTIVDNETKKYTVSAGMTKNCIVIGNSSDLYKGTHSNTLYNVSSSGTRVNCIQRTDAKFNAGRDPSLPYYYLRQGSPARNAGIDVGWTAESLDLRGEKRLVGAVDLGCYEYQPVGFSFIVR